MLRTAGDIFHTTSTWILSTCLLQSVKPLMLIMIKTISRCGISPPSAYRSLPPSGNLCLFRHFLIVCFKNLPLLFRFHSYVNNRYQNISLSIKIGHSFPLVFSFLSVDCYTDQPGFCSPVKSEVVFFQSPVSRISVLARNIKENLAN